MRLLLWLLAGVVLGVAIHITVILSLPALATDTLWSRVAAPLQPNQVELLPAVAPGAPNPLGLDPLLSYAVCRINLAAGPGVVNGTLPDAAWSIAVFDPDGTVIYSTTNSQALGKTLNVGIFDADQTRLLAEQKIDIADGLLIVGADREEVLVVVRLEPPQPAVRARLDQTLSRIKCSNMPLS
jgi:uncharacterized membrane protein